MRFKKVAKVLSTMALCVALGVSVVGCGGGGKAPASSGGSAKLSGTVALNGSTSMEKVVGIGSEKFMKDHEGVTVTYDATGSGTGVAAAKNGTCDIGLASRALKDSEKKDGLKETTVAIDGIAIIVNEKSPVKNLSMKDISNLYTGAVTDWSAVGGSGTVAAIGREAGSGTRDGFESITKTKEKCKMSQELTSTGAVIEAVRNNENAIGYASYASVVGQKGIRAVSVDGVECTEENIKNGTYAVKRPFNFITKESAKLSAPAQAFYDFMISPDAAELIKKAGAVPVAK